MLFFICGLIGAVLFAATAHNALSAGLRAVGGFLVLGTIGYFVTPTLGFNFVFLPFWVLVIGIAGLALSGMDADRMSYGGLALAVIGAIWLIVVPIFSTWGAFHADEYRNMIGEVQESQFADDVSPAVRKLALTPPRRGSASYSAAPASGAESGADNSITSRADSSIHSQASSGGVEEEEEVKDAVGDGSGGGGGGGGHDGSGLQGLMTADNLHGLQTAYEGHQQQLEEEKI